LEELFYLFLMTLPGTGRAFVHTALFSFSEFAETQMEDVRLYILFSSLDNQNSWQKPAGYIPCSFPQADFTYLQRVSDEHCQFETHVVMLSIGNMVSS